MCAPIHEIAREYCRRARLRKLCAARVQVSARRIEPAFVEDPRSRFAGEVLDRLDGPVLRYSMRLELIRLATRLGLSRFDANLIIAQVQHRSGARHNGVEAATRRPFGIVPIAFAAAVQLSIVAAAYAVFC